MTEPCLCPPGVCLTPAPYPKCFEPYLVAGSRVSYSVPPSGVHASFAVYCGRVIKVMNRESLVVFDDGYEHWVDNESLVPEKV